MPCRKKGEEQGLKLHELAMRKTQAFSIVGINSPGCLPLTTTTFAELASIVSTERASSLSHTEHDYFPDLLKPIFFIVPKSTGQTSELSTVSRTFSRSKWNCFLH